MTSRYSDMLDALLAGILDPAAFDHRDHIGIGFEAIRRYGVFEALMRVADGLQNLAIRAGVPDKFNATITLAAMSLIAERMHDDTSETAEAFVTQNGDAFSGAFLTRQYDASRLNSALAREVPLLPGAQFGAG